jgi:hypothetical protein
MPQALQLNDTTYAGEAASWMLLRPVATADTVEKGCIHIAETKKQYHYPRLEITNWLQKDSPTPVSSGTITVDGNVITLNTFQIYLEFDPQQFSQHWYANELQNQIIDRSLPQTIETYLMKHLFEKNNQKVDGMIWRSRMNYDPTNPSYYTPASKGADTNDSDMYYFDGLLTQALSDANTIKVSSTYTLSATNSVAALQDTYNLVPIGLLNKFGAYGLKFLVSYRTMQLIEQNYNITTTFKNPDFSQTTPQFFLGYSIVPISGFPDNTIIACLASPDQSRTNTFLAVNSTDDQSQVKLAPTLNFSDIWGLRAKMKMNVGWGFTDQLVVFTTITA